MLKTNLKLTLRNLAAPALLAGALAILAPATAAQEAKPNQQTPEKPTTTETPATAKATVATQTGAESKTGTSPAAGATAPAAAEPLYKEYKGVKLGMGAEEVRAKLGKAEEKSDAMDFFVFSDRERARVYYDADKKAQAIIVTYVGANSEAPSPSAVLGAEVESKEDGSAYRMVTYPQAGYWVAYSRTAGDSPMVMITMQKTP